MPSEILNLQNAVTFIVALSIATERFTEILKTTLFPSLLIEQEEVKEEARRQAKIQGLAASVGITFSLLSYPITGSYFLGFFDNDIPQFISKLLTILFIGLLASGTSGAWNGILGTLLRVKEDPKPKPPTI